MIKLLNRNISVSRLIVLLIALIALTACSEKKSITNLESEELEDIKKPILELYKSLKVDNESTPDFDYIISLFTDTANLGFVKEDSLILKTPDNYFSGMQGGIDAGMIKLLHEWEINGETEYFDNIAHHISTYGVYFGTTDSIAERGITSFQLVKLKGDWKIQSMIWKSENAINKIPKRYLKSVNETH